MKHFASLVVFLAFAAAPPTEKASVGGPTSPDGVEVQNDLPREFHIQNRGGSDGAGLCVFASLQHAAKWQDVEPLANVFAWMTTKPGGGWPEKVDRVVDDICRAKKLPKPAYLQIEGVDFELIRRACQTGRMPAVTYAFSPSGRYGGARIAHMVNLVHADNRWCAVLDNNFPGTIEWMSPAEFQRTWTGGGQGWAIILLADGPPPPPRN
jgi:hypothetical protein